MWLGQRVGLMGLGVLISVGLAESWLRRYHPQPIYAIRYSTLGWSHVPNVSFVRGGETGEFVAHVRYNSRGLRDKERSYEKASEIQRVVVVGDSFVEALEVDLEQTFVHQLEDALNHHFTLRRFEVLNLGVSAYDTGQEWRYLTTEGVRYHPNLVVLVWVSEEGSPFVRLVNGQPVFLSPKFTRTQVTLQEMKSTLKLHSHIATLIFERFKANQSVAELFRHLQVMPLAEALGVPQQSVDERTRASDPQVQDALFRAMAQACKQHGSRLLVAALSSNGAHQLARRFDRLGLSEVPIVSFQQGSDANERQYFYPLNGHYNPAGHQKAAQVLLETIVQKRLLELGPAVDLGSRGRDIAEVHL